MMGRNGPMGLVFPASSCLGSHISPVRQRGDGYFLSHDKENGCVEEGAEPGVGCG